MEQSNQQWENILRLLAKGEQPSAEQLNLLTDEELDLLGDLKNDDAVSVAVSFLDKINEQNEWETLRKKVTPNRSISWFNVVLRYAAIIALPLLLASAAYFLYNRNAVINNNTASNIIASTDHKKARLILEDGSSVNLNEKPNTKLKQGSTDILNRDSATLSYTSEKSNASNAVAYNKLIVPRGGEYKLELADGTEVWLNAATTLKYPIQFNGAPTRDVYLENGEAYFHVAKNAAQPFIVHTAKSDVEVLGTSFNINTYSKNIYTTLVEGKVKMTAGNKTTLLLPNKQAYFDADKNELSAAKNVDVMPFVAWKDGWMIFTDNSLEEVMEWIGRWYDYDVVFSSNALKDMRFGGSLKKYSSVKDVLDIIQKSNTIQCSITNRTITISPKK